MEIDQHLELINTIDNGINPGIALAVIRNGELVQEICRGFANLETQCKITPGSNFRLASLSKQFTAMAFALLEKEGRVGVHDKINQHISSLPDCYSEITFYHLIHHLSGLPDYFHLCSNERVSKPLSNQDILQFLADTKKLCFAPGTRHEYSNTGYNVLGSLIEILSGHSYREFMENRLFPLAGMKLARVIEDANTKIPERVYGYSAWPFFENIDYNSGNFVHGEDGIYCSLSDLVRWVQAIEKNVLTDKDTMRKIFSSGKTNAGVDVGYAYGWALQEYNKHLMIFHEGSWTGFRTTITYFPQESFWCICMTNSEGLSSWDMIKPFIDQSLK